MVRERFTVSWQGNYPQFTFSIIYTLKPLQVYVTKDHLRFYYETQNSIKISFFFPNFDFELNHFNDLV